jgi:hypothetical protein
MLIVSECKLRRADTPAADRSLSRVKLAVCQVLGYWFTQHFRDFKKNDALFQRLRDFMKVAQEEFECMSDSEKSKSGLPEFKISFDKKSEQGTFMSMYDSSVIVDNPPAPVLPADMKNFTFMDIPEVRSPSSTAVWLEASGCTWESNLFTRM